MFHPINAPCAPCPAQLNNPFNYEPHPLCRQAAEEVRHYVEQQPLLAAEVAQGKMMGVLVCRRPDGQLGFLAAYSGQIGGREDWPWFVPAIFDYLQPDGHFKQEESNISAINKQIADIESSDERKSLKEAVAQLKDEAQAELNSYKQMMSQAKQLRDEQRRQGCTDMEALTKQSQHQKAEWRRLKQRWTERVAHAELQLKASDERIASLRQERCQRSEALQQWLFNQFVVMNLRGETRTLTHIFACTPQLMPPSGAGECCAPKLLQYAFLHQLRPVAMAEYWQGASPKMEVRRHGHYYPACRGKCKPILEWMLCMDAEPQAAELTAHQADSQLNVVYEDSQLLVVDKPAGLLSVPGKTGQESVESILASYKAEVFMVHRLDQDTSGLMVVALTRRARRLLQQQFAEHSIRKKYIALLEGVIEGDGTISLPIRSDHYDRPRQVVDYDNGKQAITGYSVLGIENGHTRVALTPLTGRTHQLRIHCAHHDGLNVPIVGDRLYGHIGERLCLHAAELTFVHPATGQAMTFQSKVPF